MSGASVPAYGRGHACPPPAAALGQHVCKASPRLGACPSRCPQRAPLPQLPQSNPAREGQWLLPHLKRRNSELMFTFPVERQDGGEAWGLPGGGGGAVPPVFLRVTALPAPLTFREDVHPVPVVELLQNEIHSLLVDAISCQEAVPPFSLHPPGPLLRPPWAQSSSSPSPSGWPTRTPSKAGPSRACSAAFLIGLLEL